MQRSYLFLKDKLASLHHQSTYVLRRTGGPKQQASIVDNASSAYSSSSLPLHSTRRRDQLRIQIPKRLDSPRLCSISPTRFGARPHSLFGITAFRAPRTPSKPFSGQSEEYMSSRKLLITQKSSVSSLTAVIVAGFLGGVFAYTVSPSDTGRREGNIQIEQEHVEFADNLTGNQHKMTGESLPGRPGTLTPAEEEKLREFWVATLKVFGVIEKHEAEDEEEVNGNGHAQQGIARTGTDKPKKKRFGILRKKNKDDKDTASIASSAPTEDDKYGQTKEFNDAIASLSPETLRATFWSMVKHDHPDALLLRFLRARKWDIEKALVMMVSTMRWRAQDVEVDSDIVWNGELGALKDAEGSDPAKKKLGQDFLAQLRLGKSFLHGQDKEGRPMCFVRVRLHKQGEQSEQSLEKYTVFVIESARMVLAPPVDTAVSLSRPLWKDNVLIARSVLYLT